MSLAVTESGQVKCLHQGSVQLQAGQSKLTVDGNKVLIDGDLATASISGCVTPDDAPHGNIPCKNVATSIAGVAMKLTVGGKGVILDAIGGLTNGATPVGGLGTWSVQNAGQTKLKAV